MELSAIIAAGGAGERMGTVGSKQLMMLGSRPVLARTVAIFQELEIVRQIIIAIDAEDIERCREEVVDRYGFGKVRRIVAGGASRAESVRNALEHAGPEMDAILVHDGARPLFPPELLERGLKLLAEQSVDGVVFGLPVTDTIKEADEKGRIVGTLDRRRLWAAQTPQLFRRSILDEAYRVPQEELAAATDDASLVERAGGRVHMVEGSPDNIKLTVWSDIPMAEAILAHREAEKDSGA